MTSARRLDATSRPARGRLRSARLGGLGALLTLAGGAGGCGAEPAGFRHVVLISLDTTRADHLECYGHPEVRTPHLAGLAADGVLFRDVTAPAPTTLASHVSMMTGLAPRVHGVARNGFQVDRENVLLAERMKAAGFRTAAFLGSFALDHHFGFHRGFDEFDRDFDVLLDGRSIDQNQRRADKVTDAVLAYLDRSEAPSDDRHFLFVHYFDPHNPYDPPPPFDTMYGGKGVPGGADLDDVTRSIARHHARAGQPAMSQAALFEKGLTAELVRGAAGEALGADRQIAALYAGEISYLDHHVGRLLTGLDERGLLDDALVVVTGDHGETFWEHADVWNHGLWVYDTTVRVPLIVRFPDGRGAGRDVPEPVSTVDLVPTLLELLELPPPEGLDGRSLVPAIDGATLAPVAIVTEATQPAGALERGVAWRNELKPKAIREGRWKYVVAPYLQLEQLFDVEADPLEQRDRLVEPDAEALAARDRLRAALARWAAERTPRPSVFSAGANAEVVGRLQALGYLGGAPPPADGR